MTEQKSNKTGWVKKTVSRILMGLGVSFLIFLGMFMVTVGRFMTPSTPTLPDRMVLRYVLEDGLYETQESSTTGFSLPFESSVMTLQDMICAINTASGDDRVDGLVLRIRPGNYGLAHVQSLRRAIHGLRESGKFAYVYNTTFGGMAPATSSYYLASAFEQIWLQPVGVVGIHGFAYEMPFFRDLFDKIGIVPDIQQAGEYKTAAENLTRRSMSPENRTMMEGIIGDFYDQFAKDIAKDREMERATLDKLVNDAPITDDKALESGLVTHLGYMDQFIDAVDKRAGKKSRWVDLRAYNAAVQRKQNRFDNKIAVIHVDGPIMDTRDRSQGPLGRMAYDFGDILDAMNMAAKSDDIKAVVLRINSPGGSPEASETLRRTVTKVLEKKPVVVSMGNMAASGGYWAAANASHIVAEPMTLTGSIGVFGGKISLPGLLKKWGIQVDAVTEGGHANMWSLARPFTKDEEKKVEALLQDVYGDFVTRVAHGRGMHRDDVEKLAKGRVYTGRQALENGLVDTLGGLDDAAVDALVLAGGNPEDGLALLSFPPPRTPVEKLMSLLGVRMGVSQLWDGLTASIKTLTNPQGLGVYAVEMDWKG